MRKTSPPTLNTYIHTYCMYVYIVVIGYGIQIKIFLIFLSHTLVHYLSNTLDLNGS